MSVFLSICLFVRPILYLLVIIYLCWSVYLIPICLRNCIYLSVYLTITWHVCLSICLSIYLSISIYIYLSVYLTITITRHGGEEGITCHLISFDSKSEQAGWASRLVTVTLAAARRVKKWATPVTYKVHYIHTGVYVFSVVLGRCFKSGWP